MCRSMVDIHSATPEIRREKKKKKKPHGKNMMSTSATQGSHNNHHHHPDNVTLSHVCNHAPLTHMNYQISTGMTQQFFFLSLDIQTGLSEAANTSSLWIWRKFIQRFPRKSWFKSTWNKHGFFSVTGSTVSIFVIEIVNEFFRRSSAHSEKFWLKSAKNQS